MLPLLGTFTTPRSCMAFLSLPESSRSLRTHQQRFLHTLAPSFLLPTQAPSHPLISGISISQPGQFCLCLHTQFPSPKIPTTFMLVCVWTLLCLVFLDSHKAVNFGFPTGFSVAAAWSHAPACPRRLCVYRPEW